RASPPASSRAERRTSPSSIPRLPRARRPCSPPTRLKAHPWSSPRSTSDGRAQAIVASSGCSNVCTGEQGIKDAREITETVGELLRIKPNQVLIAATGVIGTFLPMDKIRVALPKLVKGLSPQGGRSAAEAIMTTDTRPKEAALRVEVGGRPITIGGIAK